MFLHQILQPLIYTSESDEESDDVISVSTAICQLTKGEDVVPRFEKNETHVACMAGDGHSGPGCKRILDANSSAILHCMLVDGLENAMQMCLQLCEDEMSGAMVVLTLYTIAERKLAIASVGDASCTVYQHNRLIHAQPHHNCATVSASSELVQQMHSSGFSIESTNRPTMVPSQDGETMTVELKPGYFKWGFQQIGAGSFVGHRSMGRLDPFITECIVPEGDFHLVMTSDGVSDMVHPEDRLLSTIDVTATAIVEDAKKRWTVPYFKPLTQKGFEKYNKSGFFVLNPYSTTIRQTASINGRQMEIKKVLEQQENDQSKVEFINGAVLTVTNSSIRTKEHNKGGDDISVLVMTVKST